MKHIACVYNPGSGSAPDKEKIAHQCEELGIEVSFFVISEGQRSLAHQLTAGTYDCVVAAGGDGTVRFTAELAVKCNLTLGILPLGTLNHFAKDLGLPTNLEQAARIISSGKTSKRDYCSVNGRVFVNNASIGIYPATVRGRETIQKKWGKWPAAVKAFADAVRSNKNLNCSVVTPEGSWDYSSPLIFVGNNKYDIDRAGLAGRDTIGGGKLFLYVVRAARRRTLISMACLSVFGIRVRRADAVKLTAGPVVLTANKSSVDIALDGEVMRMQFPLNFEIYVNKLQVITAVRP